MSVATVNIVTGECEPSNKLSKLEAETNEAFCSLTNDDLKRQCLGDLNIQRIAEHKKVTTISTQLHFFY